MTDTETPTPAAASNGMPEFNFGHLNVTADSTRRYGLSIITPGAWIEGVPAQVDINPA